MELVYGETLFTTARLATTDNTEVMFENCVCVWGERLMTQGGVYFYILPKLHMVGFEIRFWYIGLHLDNKLQLKYNKGIIKNIILAVCFVCF